jgi:putative nucleotidyltransferase with HDIG domain
MVQSRVRPRGLNLSLPTISAAIQDDAAWSAASAQTRELGHITGEDDHRRKDGTTFPVEVDVVSVDRGDSQYILGIARDITERKNAEGRVTDTLTKLKRSLDGIIQAMATVVEMRDPYTAGHQRRVADLAVGIGREMGLHEDRLEGLRVSGLLHDIGKIAVPAEILSKPGRLTNVEFDIIRGHPEAGHAILAQVDFPWPVAKVALQHHEAMNGSGYPAGLRGDEILLESRILAVADVVEAMASHRPYRPALGIEAALAEVLRERGRRFDPDVADACVRLISDKAFVFH